MFRSYKDFKINTENMFDFRHCNEARIIRQVLGSWQYHVGIPMVASRLLNAALKKITKVD